ncbi:hypothetical protein DKX38_016831 [Salix brachista]|uniref:CCHC-type domain-containing protein n=1 Tax=Salix brachista TaxID=2182728 RepID=A0A5N5KTL7_9ROSI|nr:hypothetical protein DKX38_016831 [Salix brachista]
MPECSCGQMKVLIDRYQQDCVIQFLMGLNESYSNVRDQIMLMDPIPQVSKVFSLVQQQEKQHQMLLNTPAIESMALFAKNASAPFKPFSRTYCPHCKIQGHSVEDCFKLGNSKPPICSHCNMSGHLAGKCYKLVGYPPGHKLYNRGRRPGGNTRQTNMVIAEGVPKNHVDKMDLISNQYQKILKLLHENHTPVPTMSMANTSNLPSMSGHISNSRLRLIKDPIVTKNSSFIDNTDPCSVCPMARQYRLSFDQSLHKSSWNFELVYCDLWGPCSVTAYDAPADLTTPIIQQQHNPFTLDHLNINPTSFDPAANDCSSSSNSDDLSSNAAPLPETSDTSISPLHMQPSPYLTDHTPISTSSSPHIPDAEKLRGLTLDMRALMEDNFTEVICGDSMVHDKHYFFQRYRLPAFPSREWLSDLFFGEQLQISQASLLPVLSTDALRNMRNVKFLQLNYMKFYGSYEHFPKNLIWLCWHGFSLRSLPKHLCLEKVVVLDLSRSCLVDAWKGKLFLPKLKILDLRHSHGLIRTPDLSGWYQSSVRNRRHGTKKTCEPTELPNTGITSFGGSGANTSNVSGRTGNISFGGGSTGGASSSNTRPAVPPSTLIKPTMPTHTTTPNTGFRCFNCGEPGHRFAECKKGPRRGLFSEMEEISREQDGDVETEAVYDEEERVEGDTGPMLMVRRSCLAPRGVEDDWLRTNVFQSTCTISGKVCQFIIDSGSCENVVSDEVVRKLHMTTKPHPKPYKLTWLDRRSDVTVSKRSLVSFSIGTIYKDQIWCDVDAEKLRGLTLDMRALMEDNFTEVICGDSMVHDKHYFFQRYRLPAFPSREWLSDLFFGEQLQISQASLLPVLSTDALRNMRNVKFLQLNYMKFYGSYEHFPKNLIWLCWHGFSLRSLPKHLCLEKVVVLDLSRSCLVDAWKGKLFLPKLKILDLRHSHGLIRTPDLLHQVGIRARSEIVDMAPRRRVNLPNFREQPVNEVYERDEIARLQQQVETLTQQLAAAMAQHRGPNPQDVEEESEEDENPFAPQPAQRRPANDESRQCKKGPRRGLFSEMEEISREQDGDVETEAVYDEEERVEGDTGPMLMVRRSCLAPRGVEDDWLRTNVFQSTCTISGKVVLLPKKEVTGGPLTGETSNLLTMAKFEAEIRESGVVYVLMGREKIEVNRSTKFSPFEIVYRFLPRCPLDLANLPSNSKVHHKAEDLITQLQDIHNFTRQNLLESVTKFKHDADRKRRMVDFQVGEFVWVVLTKDRFPAGEYNKLSARKIGPVEIIEKINSNAYRLKLPSHIRTADTTSHLVQIHESIGDLRSLVMLNLKNCKSLVELPEELCGLNSLKELYLNGCSNLESLNFQLENHQGHRFLESDACAASTPSIIRSLSLKLLFPSRFSARKAPRFTLPHSLTRLDLSGTPIRFLPESIKDLSPLVALTLRNCQMLQTLPELPSNLSSLDVSSSYSLQRVPNLIPWTVVYDCDQLADIQDWVKLELIQKADSHMFRILEWMNAHIQPWIFQVTAFKGVFNVAVSDEDGMVKFYEEEEEEWIIQKEFVGHLSFQIASPAAHRICAFNLFTRFRTTRETRLRGSVNIEIRNNTSGRSLFCPASFFPSGYRHGNGVIQSLSHWKLGVEDPTFDNGDDVSISVLSLDPTIQVMMVGILWLHEEEGKGNGDGDKIQSNNKVVTSQCSSSSSREVSATHNSSDADDDVHLAKTEIASRIFRNYSCSARYNPGNLEVSSWLFEKKGERVLIIYYILMQFGIIEKQEIRIFLASCMFDSAVRDRG